MVRCARYLQLIDQGGHRDGGDRRVEREAMRAGRYDKEVSEVENPVVEVHLLGGDRRVAYTYAFK